MTLNLGADLIHEEFNNAKGNENQVAESCKSRIIGIDEIAIEAGVSK